MHEIATNHYRLETVPWRSSNRQTLRSRTVMADGREGRHIQQEQRSSHLSSPCCDSNSSVDAINETEVLQEARRMPMMSATSGSRNAARRPPAAARPAVDHASGGSGYRSGVRVAADGVGERRHEDYRVSGGAASSSGGESVATNVFISYFPDPELPPAPGIAVSEVAEREAQHVRVQRHRLHIQQLVVFLRSHGVECTVDFLKEDEPPEDWLVWLQAGVMQCDYVLLVITPAFSTYLSGTMAAADMHEFSTHAGMFDMQCRVLHSALQRPRDIPRSKFIPVFLATRRCSLPLLLSGSTSYSLSLPLQLHDMSDMSACHTDTDKLYSRLTRQLRVAKAPLGQVRRVTPVPRGAPRHRYSDEQTAAATTAAVTTARSAPHNARQLVQRTYDTRRTPQGCDRNRTITQPQNQQPPPAVGNVAPPGFPLARSSGADMTSAIQRLQEVNMSRSAGQTCSKALVLHTGADISGSDDISGCALEDWLDGEGKVLDFDAVPSDDALLKFTWHMSPRDKFIAHCLGTRDAMLRQIALDSPDDWREQAYRGLSEWVRAAGDRSSYRVLAETLVTHGLRHLVAKLAESVRLTRCVRTTQ